MAAFCAAASAAYGTQDVMSTLIQCLLGSPVTCALFIISILFVVPNCCRWVAAGSAITPPKHNMSSHRIRLSFDADSREQALLGEDPPAPPVSGGDLWRRLRRRLACLRGTMLPRDPITPQLTRPTRRRSFGRSSSGGRSEALDPLPQPSIADLTCGGGLLRRRSKGRSRPALTSIPSSSQIAGSEDGVAGEGGIAAAPPLPVVELDVVARGVEAAACLGHELTAAGNAEVQQVVTEEHLLQFSAMLNEPSALPALAERGGGGWPLEEGSSAFGVVDNLQQYEQGWEKVVQESKLGVHYWAWRRHLRKGLYMYKSRAVYERAVPAHVVAFVYDDEFRRSWDDSSSAQRAIHAPAECSGGGVSATEAADIERRAFGRSAYMYARTRFPPPMASREYVYARRAWARPDDGGIYALSRSCPHPGPPAPGCRVVRVDDFMSGMVIRAAPGINDSTAPAVEIVSIYFEDSHCRAGLVNLAVRKALWPMMMKNEAALRRYQGADMPRAAVARGCCNAAALAEQGSYQAPPVSRPAPLVLDGVPAALDGALAGPAAEAQSPRWPMSPRGVSVLGSITQSWCPTMSSTLRVTPRLYTAYLGAWRLAAAGVAAARALACVSVRGAAAVWLLWIRAVAAALWLLAALAVRAGRAASISYVDARALARSVVHKLSLAVQRLAAGKAGVAGSEDSASDAGSTDTTASGGSAFSAAFRSGFTRGRAGNSRRSVGGPSRSLRLQDFGGDGNGRAPVVGSQQQQPMPQGLESARASGGGSSSGGNLVRRGSMGSGSVSGALPPVGFRKWVRGLAALAVKAAAAQVAHRVLKKGNSSGSLPQLGSMPRSHTLHHASSASAALCSMGDGGPGGRLSSSEAASAASAASFSSRRQMAAAAFGAYNAYGAPSAASCAPAVGALTQFKGTGQAGRGGAAGVAGDLERRFARRSAFV